MLSVTDAISILECKSLPGLHAIYGCDVSIIDGGIEEYDWGWVFYIAPASPSQCIRPHYADVVTAVIFDRATGHFADASEATLKFEIENFLHALGRTVRREDLNPRRQSH